MRACNRVMAITKFRTGWYGNATRLKGKTLIMLSPLQYNECITHVVVNYLLGSQTINALVGILAAVTTSSLRGSFQESEL